MDLAAELQDRYQQIAGLSRQLPELYIELQNRYETQKKEVIEYKCKANYWEAQFSELKSREDLLLAEMGELKAALKKREQQVGSKGHGRRDYSHLPVVDEVVSIVDAHCPCCQLPYQELSGTEDSEVLDMTDVKAYRRAIHRKKYKRRCQCPKNEDPQIICAPVTEKLIPKSKIGISIWAHALLQKYEYQQPLHRVLEELNNYGLSLSSGTMTDGMKMLLPLFVPVYDAIVERSLEASHWHADETGWKVFEDVEDKKNHRWYLWIFHNAETVIYIPKADEF